MQLRCYRCGNSFALSQPEIAAALEDVKSAGRSHYDARCPRCRTTNKVPLAQLERAVGHPPKTEA
jgi:phage FluMu protein Com